MLLILFLKYNAYLFFLIKPILFRILKNNFELKLLLMNGGDLKYGIEGYDWRL